MRRGPIHKSRKLPPRSWRQWLRDNTASVSVYVALTATVTFGLIGLAVDGSRAMIVRSESQAAADAAALAAASQLDGTPSAITRAGNAIEDLVANRQGLASTGGSEVGIASVRYLSALPDDDDDPITDDFVTTDPLDARFVEVTTAPLTHVNTFLLSVGATESVAITTTAVGGGRQMVCNTQPLMICNPSELNGSGEPFDIAEWRGRQIRLVSQQSGSLQPGIFGFLSPGANGASALAQALASTAGANACYGPGVETEPGLNNGARNAINTRFGMYENPMFGGNARNNPLYAPDLNVRTMPRDLVFSGPQNRFGNGRWNCLTYWNANFPGVTAPANCADNSNALSRYQVTQYEIANNLQLNPPLNFANRLANRRIVYVAVVNCLEQNVHGRMEVLASTFLKVFITEPVADPNNVAIYGEVVDIVQVGVDETVLHEIVQLYR